MYIKVHNKKIDIKCCTSFIDRFKSLKFILEKLDYGIMIPKKKFINTYFFCQRVDVCVTDKDNKIVILYENYNSEKHKFKWKFYNIYYLPLDTVKYLKVGDEFYPKEK